MRSMASDGTFVDDVSEPGVSGRIGIAWRGCCTSLLLGGSGNDLFGENIRLIVETRSRSDGDGLGGVASFWFGGRLRVRIRGLVAANVFID